MNGVPVGFSELLIVQYPRGRVQTIRDLPDSTDRFPTWSALMA
jgi:hypothetical protein